MDVYFRGYGSGINEVNEFSPTMLGTAALIGDSAILGGLKDVERRFYATAWSLPAESGEAGPEIVISYRGTDDLPDFSNVTPLDFAIDRGISKSGLRESDIWLGYGTGAGLTHLFGAHGELAFEFFQAVQRLADDSIGPLRPLDAKISLTGHSLGGGLAGLVGSVYQQPTVGFDAMPFTQAARATILLPEALEDVTSQVFRQLIYVGFEAWESLFGSNLDGLIDLISIEGEFLSPVRSLMAERAGTEISLVPFSQSDETLYYSNAGFTRLGQDGIWGLLSDPHTGLGLFQLHSVSTLVIRQFADQYRGQWVYAMPELWQALYDTDFAGAVLSDRVPGLLADQGKYDDILRTVIAYSVLEEGVLPFGNAAVRALMEDAQEIGGVIANVASSSSTTVSLFLRDNLDLIARMVVQNAGEHAIQKTTYADANQFVTGLGIVSSGYEPGDEFLSINLDIAKSFISGSFLSELSVYRSLFPASSDLTRFLSTSFSMWGSSSFSKLIFAGRSTGVLDTSETFNGEVYPFFIVAGDADTVVLGSPNDELIYGGTDGTDNLYGGGGRDLIYGNGGDDNLFGDAGDDVLYGGPGRDVLMGGDGRDRFVFSPLDTEQDEIKDLSIGDQISILAEVNLFNGVVYTETTSGELRFVDNRGVGKIHKIVVTATLPAGTVLGRIESEPSRSAALFEVVAFSPVEGLDYHQQGFNPGRPEFDGHHLASPPRTVLPSVDFSAESITVYDESGIVEVPVRDQDVLAAVSDISVDSSGNIIAVGHEPFSFWPSITASGRLPYEGYDMRLQEPEQWAIYNPIGRIATISPVTGVASYQEVDGSSSHFSRTFATAVAERDGSIYIWEGTGSFIMGESYSYFGGLALYHSSSKMTSAIAGALIDNPPRIETMEFSPSGELYGLTRENSLYSIDPSNGTFQKIADITGANEQLSQLSFTPDGHMVASSYFRSYLIDIGSETATSLSGLCSQALGVSEEGSECLIPSFVTGNIGFLLTPGSVNRDALELAEEDYQVSISVSTLLANDSDRVRFLKVRDDFGHIVQVLDQGTSDTSDDVVTVPASALTNGKFSFRYDAINSARQIGTSEVEVRVDLVANKPSLAIVDTRTIGPVDRLNEGRFSRVPAVDAFNPSMIAIDDNTAIIAYESRGVPEDQGQGVVARFATIGSSGVVSSSENIRIAENIASEQYAVKTQLVSDSLAFFSWTTEDPLVEGAGNGSSIVGRFARIGDVQSLSFGEETLLHGINSSNQLSAQVDRLTDDSVVVVWHDYDPTIDRSNFIRGSVVVFDETDSTEVVVEFTVYEEPSGYAYFADVAAIDGSTFFTVWSSTNTDFEDADAVRGALVSFDGENVSVSAPITVNPVAEGQQLVPQVVSLGDQRILVTWHTYFPDSDTGNQISAIIGDVQTDGSIVFGPEATINANVEGFSLRPSIEVLPDGRVLFVWHSNAASDGGAAWDVFARVGSATADGEITLMDSFRVNANTSYDQFFPVASSLHDNRVLVSWHSFDGGPFGNGWGIDAATIDLLAPNFQKNQPFRLPINAQLNDLVGDEVLTLTLRGLPAGFRVSDGLMSVLVEGDVEVDISEFLFDRLFVTPSLDWTGRFEVTAKAVATEPSNGRSETTVGSIEIVIEPEGEIIELFPGTDEDDEYTGTENGETISGLLGDDRLFGLGGDDVIDGGPGSDLLSGGDGNDTLKFSNDQQWIAGFVAWNVGSPKAPIDGEKVRIEPRVRSHDSFDGGAGSDTIELTNDADALALDDIYSPNPLGETSHRISGIEIIKAFGGNDIVDLTSPRHAYGDVQIEGGDGEDVLWSSEGNDRLDGGAGDDNLDGGFGDDELVGGDGEDVLFGRLGEDRLEGGLGADRFVISDLDDSIDSILDFSTSEGDVVDFALTLFDFDELRIDDFFKSEEEDGDTIISVDTTGSGTQFQAAVRLQGIVGVEVSGFFNDGHFGVS